MDAEFKKKLDRYYESIHAGKKLSSADFRDLYEMIGIELREEHGAAGNHNPCSVEVITGTVLRMAEKITPCRLLDIGVGGFPVIDTELMKKGFAVTGLEYSASLIGIAREILEKSALSMPLVLGDAQNLPFTEESFDACLCSETLEHLPDDRKAVLEIHRVLKAGGRLILTVPNLWAFLGIGKKILKFCKSGSWVTHPTHLREYDFFTVRKLFSGLFEIESWHSVPFTSVPSPRMPYENALGRLVSLPFLKWGSLSYAFILRKK